MRGKVIKIDATEIVDWATFHSVFSRDLGFPNFYGENMNAWIDCVTSIDDAESGMTAVTVASDELAVLEITGVNEFRARCQEQYDALIECSAFVNYRCVEVGERPILALILID